ncbi:MAG: hypothetical protein ACOC56_02880 [Atribacterota bacterium]
MKTGNKIEVILGIVVVFYIIADTLPDAFNQLTSVNETMTTGANETGTVKGVVFLKLLPLIAGVGLLYLIYRSTLKK